MLGFGQTVQMLRDSNCIVSDATSGRSLVGIGNYTQNVSFAASCSLSWGKDNGLCRTRTSLRLGSNQQPMSVRHHLPRRIRPVKTKQAGVLLSLYQTRPALSPARLSAFALTFVFNAACSEELRIARSMVLQYLTVALYLAHLSTAASFESHNAINYISEILFHPSSYSTNRKPSAAPYLNSTTTPEASITTAASASQTLAIIPSSYISYVSDTARSNGYTEAGPGGTGPHPTYSHQNALRNFTKTGNASCTVHIPDASLDWWYPVTYMEAVATLANSWGNYSANSESFVLIPQTTVFDVSQAISGGNGCTYGFTTYTAISYTAWECMPYSEIPTAANTVVLTRSDVRPLPSKMQIAMTDALLYDDFGDVRPPMTTTVSLAPNMTTVATMPTPFVRFSAYEIEQGNSRETVQLDSVHIQPYSIEDVDQHTSVIGPIPGGFMDKLHESGCEAGELFAVVTVIIFVEMYYPRLIEPGWVHWEEPVDGWEEVSDTWGTVEVVSVDVKPHKLTEGGDLPTGIDQNFAPTDSLFAVSDPTSRTRVQTVGSVGTVPIVVGPSSILVVGSQTLRPGGPAITEGGIPIALIPSATAIVVEGTPIPIPQNTRPGRPQTIGTLGSVPVVVGPSSIVVVGTQTLQPGGAPITLGPGSTISLARPGPAVVVGGTTSFITHLPNPRPQAPAPPVLTIGTTTLVPNAATQFYIAPGQTLTPGGTAVVDNTRVSLDALAGFVVVGSSTQSLSPSGQSNKARPQLIFGGSTFTALPTRVQSEQFNENGPGNNGGPRPQRLQDEARPGPTFVISGQTLVPGGAPITVSGSTLSLAPSGAYMVVDGTTTDLASPAAAHVTAPPLSIGNGVFRPLPGTGTTYQIGTALLTPGGSIVVTGTTISLAIGATALVVDGVTSTLAIQAAPVITNPPLLAVGDETFAAEPGTGTAFVIGGQTLTPGGTITVYGTTIILSPLATELVYGSSGRSTTTALFPATTTRGRMTTAMSSASAGPSGETQAVPTSTREGRASQLGSPLTVLICAIGVLGIATVMAC